MWVQFPVSAGSSYTKDVKNGNGPYLHDTKDEVGTTNITGWPGISTLCMGGINAFWCIFFHDFFMGGL